MSTRTPEAARQYADDVIRVLAPEFPDLEDVVIASIVRRRIRTHAETPGRLEVIVDNPVNANWKLVADRDHPGRVRIGCWHIPPLSDSVRERQERINAALAAIGTETQR